jgi:hypothetical protein
MWESIAGDVEAEEIGDGLPFLDDHAPLQGLISPYVGTAHSVIAAGLQLAALTEHDLLLDLGSGDGPPLSLSCLLL